MLEAYRCLSRSIEGNPSSPTSLKQNDCHVRLYQARLQVLALCLTAPLSPFSPADTARSDFHCLAVTCELQKGHWRLDTGATILACSKDLCFPTTLQLFRVLMCSKAAWQAVVQQSIICSLAFKDIQFLDSIPCNSRTYKIRTKPCPKSKLVKSTPRSPRTYTVSRMQPSASLSLCQATL